MSRWSRADLPGWCGQPLSRWNCRCRWRTGHGAGSCRGWTRMGTAWSSAPLGLSPQTLPVPPVSTHSSGGSRPQGTLGRTQLAWTECNPQHFCPKQRNGSTDWMRWWCNPASSPMSTAINNLGNITVKIVTMKRSFTSMEACREILQPVHFYFILFVGTSQLVFYHLNEIYVCPCACTYTYTHMYFFLPLFLTNACVPDIPTQS